MHLDRRGSGYDNDIRESISRLKAASAWRHSAGWLALALAI